MAEPRPIKVFYSWQSEAHSKVCRNFIEDALKKAIKDYNRELNLTGPEREDAQLVLDKDTRGVPGSPDIVESIFTKIRDADVFVGDLTVVRPREPGHRPASNANVLIETGYAFGVLGRDRVIVTFNTQFGDIPDDLPFNLKQTSICGYHADPESQELGASRKFLVDRLKEKLGSIVSKLEPQPPTELTLHAQVLVAIQDGTKNRRKLFEGYFLGIVEAAVTCIVPGTEHNPKAFINSVDRAVEVLHPCFEVIDKIAANDDGETLSGCFKGVVLLLNTIWQDGHYDGRTDLPKFIGYLIHVYVAAAFIREENFATLAGFLEEQHSIRLRNGQPHTFTYGEFSRSIKSLEDFDEIKWYCPVGAFVRRLCDEKKLPLSAEAYVEADTILWLRSGLACEAPWSPQARDLLNRFPPEVLLRARSRKFADKLKPLLGLETLDEAGKRVMAVFVKQFEDLGNSRGEVIGFYIYENKPEQFASR